MGMEKPILTLEALSKFYTSTQNVVVGLNEVNLTFHRGEFVAITGESGSGKSTLAHVIGGILPYESGELLINGHPTSHYDGADWERYRRDHISFISQSYGILLSATVLENVLSALRLTGLSKQEALVKAKDILQQVELWDLRRRRAAKLSSGQKQRLSIARALAKPAPILIADEPTGNLDPENSAKVISLLAQAAQDRLVILITHDFQEAEGLATRRISLLDGKVTMDSPLGTPAQPAPLPPKPPKKRQPLSLYVSRLQMEGRPVWASLVFLFFALTAFCTFAFLGTFILSLDDTSTRIYDGSAFRNGSKTRIVVQRADGAVLTEEDYQKMLSVSQVRSLEKYGYIKDINVFYQEERDYRINRTMENLGSDMDPIYVVKENILLSKFDRFAQTIPMMAENETFLTAGRLPESVWEVVMQGDESLIGTSFRLYLEDQKHWAIQSYIYFDVTVVGVTDFGSGVYLHEDIGRIFTHHNDGASKDFVYLPDATLPSSDLFRLPNSFRIPKPISSWQDLHGILHIQLNCEGMGPLQQTGDSSMNLSTALSVHPDVFRQITPDDAGAQVSLTISDYAYTDRVLDALQEMGYIAISPYQAGSTEQVESLVEQRKQTLWICLGAMLAVFALQIIVLRALFGSQTENYRLLSNIGLSFATAKRSILWQILLFTLLGQGAGFACIYICNHVGVSRIVNIVKYLPAHLFALLSAVHLAAALLAAWWIGISIQKQVYPLLSVRRESDLDLEEVAE